MSAFAGNRETPLYAWLILLLALISVSSAGAVFEIIEGVAPVTKAAWRLQATALVLLPGFMWQYKKANSELLGQFKTSLGLLTLSGICLCVHFGSWLISLEFTTLTHSLLFVTAHPLIIIVGLWLLRRPASSIQTIGALIGFCGAATVILGGSQEQGVTIFGDMMAFLGAIAVVGYLAIGRNLRGWMPLFLYAFPVTGIAAVLLTIWAMIAEGTTFTPDDMIGTFGWLSATWFVYVAYLAFGPGLFGHTGINAVLRWLPALIISMTLVMEPVIGSLIGWAIGADVMPGAWTWLGGLLMVFGTMLVTFGIETQEDE